MKKTVFLTYLMVLAASSFVYAQDVFNRSIFFEGSAVRNDHLNYFYQVFYNEAIGYGTTIADRRESAGFVFKFDVSSNPSFNTDGNRFRLTITLVNNRNNQDILIINFYYNNLEEVYEHTNSLYVKAVSVIPPLSQAGLSFVNTAWKYKWLYLSASLDYPVSFYELRGRDNLLGGNALYTPGPDGEKSEPYYNLDNKVFALPGITLGAECHFLDFMSAEVNFKAAAGTPFNESISDIKPSSVNAGIGTQLKLPVKYFDLFVIQPYGAAFFPLIKPDIYAEYPKYFLGGGIQLSTKAGRSGAVFIDISYMKSSSEAKIKNTIGIKDEEHLFPEPEYIYYKPFYVGISIGYKHGFINRPRELPNVVFSDSSNEELFEPETQQGNVQVFYY